jgi:ribonuclease HI
MKNLEIWTDGGKNREIASWAFCLYSPDLSQIVTQKYGYILGTSQEGELRAAIKAMQFITKKFSKKQLDSMNILLYSDSQYLVKGLNEWLWGWKNRSWKGSNQKTIKNLQYWQELDRLNSSIPNIRYNWVRGHSGVELNEFVDGLCQKALKEARQHEENNRNHTQ